MKRKTNAEKATIIAAALEGVASNQEIAARARVPESTLYTWKREARNKPELSRLVDEQRAKLAEKLEKLAEGIANKLIEKVDEASFDNRAGSVLASAVDRWLAVTGQPGQITESRSTSLNVNLLVDARQALALYQAEGYSAEEARGLLAEDDPELYRALISADQV